MSSYGNDGNPIIFSHFGSGLDDGEKHVCPDAQLFQQPHIELPGSLVHHAGGGGVRVFADFVSCQEIG